MRGVFLARQLLLFASNAKCEKENKMLVWFKKSSQLSGIYGSKLELGLSAAGAQPAVKRIDLSHSGISAGGHSEISAIFSSNSELSSLTGG